MKTDTTTRLTLELASGAEPIHGRVEEEGGTSREFSGWLELAALLGELIRDPAPDPSRLRPIGEGSR